jgi:hypothetical protein
MLLDHAGEMSGAPLEVNLANQPNANHTESYLAKFAQGDEFIAFDRVGAPMSLTDFPAPAGATPGAISGANGVFDDQVLHYVDFQSAVNYWVTSWGDPDDYKREIATPTAGNSGNWEVAGYAYLLAPSGGIAQPKAFKEGTRYVYQLNIPSILFQDIVLIDYYVEYRHNATQVSILPDKFGPYLYVEGSSLVRRASDGMDLPVEFVIPKFKVTTALTFTLQSTGDPSTFTFQGDAYPDFSKFDLTRRVLADIQILDADDNFDGATGWGGAPSDPTSYRRFHYGDNDGEYLWKDPSMQPHQNIDYQDTGDYVPEHGGPATRTPGIGVIDTGVTP